MSRTFRSTCVRCASAMEVASSPCGGCPRRRSTHQGEARGEHPGQEQQLGEAERERGDQRGQRDRGGGPDQPAGERAGAAPGRGGRGEQDGGAVLGRSVGYALASVLIAATYLVLAVLLGLVAAIGLPVWAAVLVTVVAMIGFQPVWSREPGWRGGASGRAARPAWRCSPSSSRRPGASSRACASSRAASPGAPASTGQVDVVAAVGTATELLDAVRRLRPGAVIADIRMRPHHMEGIDATHAIRAEHPGIDVVGAAQHADEAYAFALLRDGTDGLADLLRNGSATWTSSSAPGAPSSRAGRLTPRELDAAPRISESTVEKERGVRHARARSGEPGAPPRHMSARSLTCIGTAAPSTSSNPTSVHAPPVCSAPASTVSSESDIQMDPPSPRPSW